MLSLLNYDVFKRTRHNFMSHLTVINVLTIPPAPSCLLNTPPLKISLHVFHNARSVKRGEIRKRLFELCDRYDREEDKSLLFSVCECEYRAHWKFLHLGWSGNTRSKTGRPTYMRTHDYTCIIISEYCERSLCIRRSLDANFILPRYITAHHSASLPRGFWNISLFLSRV